MSSESDPFLPGASEKITSRTWWTEAGILIRYTLPVFGTQLLEWSLPLTAVVAIGHVSTEALAGSTLAVMTASVTGYSIIFGFVSALDTLLPPAWTSAHPELVGLWCARMAVLMAVLLFPILAIWMNAEFILLLLGQDPEIAGYASSYLTWACLGLPAYMLNNISRRYFQSQGLFNIPTRIILIVAPINVLLSYLLVYGPEPFRLGFIGAPIASSISFNLIAVMNIICAYFFVSRRALHPLSSRCFEDLGVVIKLGMAGVGQTASEWWSWELLALAASQLGPVALATQSLLVMTASTAYQAPFSLSTAASVRIGNLLGENNPERARISCFTSLLLAFAISTFSSSMLVIFRSPFAYIFTSDPDVVELVTLILPIIALFQVFDSVAAVSGGILRTIARQVAGAILNITAYYVIGIPLGLFFAFSEVWNGKLNFGLAGLWIGLTVSLIYSAAVGVWISLRTNWAVEAAKAQERSRSSFDEKGEKDEMIEMDTSV